MRLFKTFLIFNVILIKEQCQGLIILLRPYGQFSSMDITVSTSVVPFLYTGRKLSLEKC